MEPHDDDPSGDTARFQAFQDAADEPEGHSNAFRIISLVVGLAVFAAIVVLLLQ